MIKTLVSALAAACLLLAGQAHAADATCAAQAADKKLAGAAKHSFMKKCERDAGIATAPNEACVAQATERKLAGAAKSSFMKKCEKDTAKP